MGEEEKNKEERKELPGGPVVRTPRSHSAEGLGSIPGQGTNIPYASVVWPNKLKKIFF